MGQKTQANPDPESALSPEEDNDALDELFEEASDPLDDLVAAAVDVAATHTEAETNASVSQTEVRDSKVSGGSPSRRSRSKSSTSSTSSSTSSSSLSAPEPPPDGQQPPPEHTPRIPPTGVSRRIHTESFDWGCFRITYRPQTKSMSAAWQATCRWHADICPTSNSIRTRCTRSCNIPDNDVAGARSQQKIRELQSWLLHAPTMENKGAHQKLKCDTLSHEELERQLADLPAPPEKPGLAEAKPQSRKRGRSS